MGVGGLFPAAVITGIHILGLGSDAIRFTGSVPVAKQLQQPTVAG